MNASAEFKSFILETQEPAPKIWRHPPLTMQVFWMYTMMRKEGGRIQAKKI